MNQHPTGLGDRRVQQVSADRGGRVDTEPQQNRGHQRAATNTGHADNESDNQACNHKTPITEIHCHTLQNQRDEQKLAGSIAIFLITTYTNVI